MDFVIRFIGLMLFYQAGSGAPQHAIIPRWDEQQHTFCQFKVMEHRPFIRVSTKNKTIVNDSKWPEKKKCDAGLDCVVYAIPTGTTLTIEPGFISPLGAGQASNDIPCLVPDFRTEKLVSNPELHPDALTTRSATDFVLPPGFLLSDQFKNDQIYTRLTIPAPKGAPKKNIRIVATPRAGVSGEERVLVVKAGTTIDILSAPPDHAGMDYNTEMKEENPDEAMLKGHFFFLHHLLNVDTTKMENCKYIPDIGPASCGKPRRNHRGIGLGQTMNLGCGNGRLSPAGP